MPKKPLDPVKINFRFTESLRRRLEREAARNDRSMNAEMNERLEQSFAHKPLDLFELLSSTYEKGLTRHGPNSAEPLFAVIDPLIAALEQIVPNLESVKINVKSDGSGPLSAETFSKAASAEQNS